jgi:hypothetical protein
VKFVSTEANMPQTLYYVAFLSQMLASSAFLLIPILFWDFGALGALTTIS